LGLVAHDVNGLLCDAFSPAAFAASLRSLIDDPGLLARLAAAVPVVISMPQDSTEMVGI